MKNTTFRKKALLSSVAMLLVALVALGSATFAWFAANPNADATGISLKTTAASGLVIKTETDTEWSHNAELYKGQTDPYDLQPLSQSQAAKGAANFAKVEAADSGNYLKKDGATIGTGATTEYYKENVYFKLSTGSAAEPTAKVQVSNIAITPVENAVLANAIRVSIADAAGTVLATYALNTAKENGVLNSDGTIGDFTVLETTGAKALDCGITGLTVAEDASKYVTVYVYLDGQDGDCFSDNVTAVDAAEIISSVKVDFKLTK